MKYDLREEAKLIQQEETKVNSIEGNKVIVGTVIEGRKRRKDEYYQQDLLRRDQDQKCNTRFSEQARHKNCKYTSN